MNVPSVSYASARSQYQILYSFEASDAKSDVRLLDEFLVCLFAPDLVWQEVGGLLDPNYLQTLKSRCVCV